jgi:hypothetical protein
MSAALELSAAPNVRRHVYGAAHSVRANAADSAAPRRRSQ